MNASGFALEQTSRWKKEVKNNFTEHNGGSVE